MILGHRREPGTRRLKKQLGHSTLILYRPNLEASGVVQLLASGKPEVLVSFFFPNRIPTTILRLASQGAFGAHPSLLPRWRGPDPYFWCILRGDEATGVTLHKLAPKYDEGEIIQQREIKIGTCENAGQLAHRLDTIALEMLVEELERFAAGTPSSGAPQDPDEATWAPLPSEEMLTIQWNRSAKETLRLIRAAAPIPGAMAQFGTLHGEIISAQIAKGSPPRALVPAEAYVSDEGLVVTTGDRKGVLLQRIRIEERMLSGANLIKFGEELKGSGPDRGEKP